MTNIRYGKREFYLLDILKAFFALCVVAIHTRPLQDIENQILISIYNLIISLAVPFFFTATGFLMAGEIGKNGADYVNGMRRKYIRLYLIWNIIYFPITIWGFAYNSQDITRIVLYWIRGFLFVGEQFCSWPLWYLLSIIYSTFFVEIVIRKNFNRKSIIIMAFVFFIVALGFNYALEINEVFDKVVETTLGSGRLFTGPCFVFLGMAMYGCNMNENMFKNLMGGGIALAVVSALLLQLPYSTTYIPALFLVPLVVKSCERIKINRDGKWLRDYSKVVYFTHMMCVFLFQYDLVRFQKIRTQGISCFLTAFIGTLVFYFIRLEVLKFSIVRKSK